MGHEKATPNELLLLFTISAFPRIVGAFWLPNAFGDAYAYTEQIYYMRRSLLAGTFSSANLFGFWLPLYQLVCAVISALVGSPFYVPKIVSAIAGGGVCVIVFLLTLELTANKFLSFASFAIIALNPYHVFYSASAMTDVPHAFVILLCAYCCIRDRWLIAALFALAAGLIRIESWTLIVVIPLLQLLRQRRVSLLGCAILLLGPAFWLYVSWKAGGSAWRYFEIRNTYIVETLAASPWLATFPLSRVSLDLLRLIYTTNPLVLFACCAGLFLIFKGRHDLRKLRITPGLIILVIFFFHLAFLLLAYFTRNQPEIWPRYGLFFFTLGLPIFISQLFKDEQSSKLQVQSTKKRLIYGAFIVIAVQFAIQLVDVTRITVKSDPNEVAAEFLEDQHLADSSVRIYCEDGAIRVLSGIPLEEFKDQYNSPAEPDSFLRSLRDNQIRLLVYKDLPGSRLRELIRDIQSGKVNSRRSGITLEEITLRPRVKPKDAVVLYRVHGDEAAVKNHQRRVH
jgi:hypothetical protein